LKISYALLIGLIVSFVKNVWNHVRVVGLIHILNH
jgi:hypothetical protein